MLQILPNRICCVKTSFGKKMWTNLPVDSTFGTFFELVRNSFPIKSDTPFKLKAGTKYFTHDQNQNDFIFDQGDNISFDLIFGLKGGGSANTSLVDASEVTKILNNIVVNSLQSCQINGATTQIFQINGNANNIEDILLSQTSNIDFGCFAQNANQINVLNDVINNLTSVAKTSSEFSPSLALNTSVNVSKIVNDVTSNVLVSVIQKCDENLPVTQIFQVNGSYNSVLNVTMSQNASFFTKCMFGNENVVDLSNKISNDLSASAEAASSFGAFGIIIVIVIIVIVIIMIPILMKTSPFMAARNAKRNQATSDAKNAAKNAAKSQQKLANAKQKAKQLSTSSSSSSKSVSSSSSSSKSSLKSAAKAKA